jgi:hypothetical protein
MFSFMLQAFPQRPLRLKPGRGRIGAWFTMLAGVLAIAGTIGLASAILAPPILSDLQVRDSAVAAREARFVNGRCRTRIFLFHDCDLTLRYAGKGTSVERRVNYLFVAPGSGSFTVQARVDPARPEAITSDLGIDYLWNRIATAIGLTLIGLLIGYGLISSGRRSARDARAVLALSGRNLVPAPAQLVDLGGGTNWTVRDEFGNQFTWPMRSKDRPLMLDPTRGLLVALREGPGAPAFGREEAAGVAFLHLARCPPACRRRRCARRPRRPRGRGRGSSRRS